MNSARTQRGEPGIGLQYYSVCTRPSRARKSPARKTAAEECESCKSSTIGRGTDRERCKEGAIVGGTGRRSARGAQLGNPRKSGLFLEIVRDSKVSGEREPLRFLSDFRNDDC